MPRWHELGRRMQALGEIGEMLGAMRSLAYIEARRLAAGAERRQQALAATEAALDDLATHCPELRAGDIRGVGITVAIGSQRAFCGDFNQRVARRAARDGGVLLVVGERLQQALAEDGITAAAVAGAAVLEDIPSVLGALAAAVGQVAADSLQLLHHDDHGTLQRCRILPRPEPAPAAPRRRSPPDRLAPPRTLYAALLGHYVPLCLEAALQASLLAENQRRMAHMDAAMERLDARLDSLGRARRRARREAITEEIEVILLGATAGEQT